MTAARASENRTDVQSQEDDGEGERYNRERKREREAACVERCLNVSISHLKMRRVVSLSPTTAALSSDRVKTTNKNNDVGISLLLKVISTERRAANAF